MLYTQLLRARLDRNDADAQDYLQALDKQAERMLALIGNMLDLAKIQTGRALDRGAESISALVHDAIMDFMPAAQLRGIRLDFHPGENGALCAVDVPQIRRALDNLLSNAIKYTLDSGVIEVWVEQQPSQVVVHIRDNGIGIPEKDQPFVFEPFYRVNDKTHLAIEGTGLGLAITRSIIEQHHGEITVRSQSGAGTEFTFTLPLASP
jgi:two-component system phosphate regulon sensor histidine kinase PhoR